MLRVLSRDQTSFRLLVQRWQTPLVNYFYRHLSVQDVAEELAQEVFVKVWKTRHYAPSAPFGAWIRRLARNQLIDWLRARGRRPLPEADETELERLPAQGTPEEALLAAEERIQLQKALQSLPLRQREILILSKFQDLKYQQIAETLDCSIGQVKVQVFRAVKNLAKTFRELHHD